jgi:hypothetical protein
MNDKKKMLKAGGKQRSHFFSSKKKEVHFCRRMAKDKTFKAA